MQAGVDVSPFQGGQTVRTLTWLFLGIGEHAIAACVNLSHDVKQL